jgi:hypothetical protein
MKNDIKEKEKKGSILSNTEIEIKEPNINVDKGIKVKSRLPNPKVNLNTANLDFNSTPTNLRLLLSGNIDDNIYLNNKKYNFRNILVEGISGNVEGKKKK